MTKLPPLHPSVTVRQRPTISAVALAEYLVVKPHLHDDILHDSKFVQPPIVTANAQAIDAIRAYLTDDRRRTTILEAAKSALLSKADDPALSRHSQDEALRCHEAIEEFESKSNALGVNSMPLRRVPKLSKLSIGDVTLSVQPHFIVDVVGPRGGRKTGAGLIRVAKSPNPDDCKKEFTRKGREGHRRDLAAYLIAVFELAAKANPELFPKYDRAISFVADVKLGETIRAPQDLSERIRAVEGACDKIARLWPTVMPKPAICA